MKTYRIKISKGFNEIGIRPDDIPTRNSGLLVEARQVRVTRAGMEGYTPDVNDILLTGRRFYDSITGNQVTISRRWPFPQVFLTDVGVFVGALEGLYKVIDPSPDQYPNVVLQSYSTGATVWPWICIPIPGYPAFTSGTKFVYYDSNASAYIVVT